LQRELGSVIIEKPRFDLASARELTAPSAILLPKSKVPDRSFSGERNGAEHPCVRLQRDLRAALDTHYIDHVQTRRQKRRRGRSCGYYETAAPSRHGSKSSPSAPLADAMEPPTDLSADSIRDEKVKVVRSCVVGRATRSQPTSSAVNTPKAPLTVSRS